MLSYFGDGRLLGPRVVNDDSQSIDGGWGGELLRMTKAQGKGVKSAVGLTRALESAEDCQENIYWFLCEIRTSISS
jgi:hypothetical protein